MDLRWALAHVANAERILEWAFCFVATPLFVLGHLTYWWQASDAPSLRLIVALALYAAGIALYVAKRRVLQYFYFTVRLSLDNPHRLIEFASLPRVRHPYFPSYALTWIAGAVAVPWMAMIASTAFMLTAFSAKGFGQGSVMLAIFVVGHPTGSSVEVTPSDLDAAAHG